MTKVKQPPQPYITAERDVMKMGDVKADRRNRQTGTHIVIVETPEGKFHVGCQDHGIVTSALEKWGRACDIARQPRDWCPECENAPAPEPKRRAPAGPPRSDEEAMAHARAAKAQAAAARQQQDLEAARLEMEALPAKVAHTVSELEAARETEASTFSKLDRARHGTDEYHDLEQLWHNQERRVSRLTVALQTYSARERKLADMCLEVAA